MCLFYMIYLEYVIYGEIVILCSKFKRYCFEEVKWIKDREIGYILRENLIIEISFLFILKIKFLCWMRCDIKVNRIMFFLVVVNKVLV